MINIHKHHALCKVARSEEFKGNSVYLLTATSIHGWLLLQIVLFLRHLVSPELGVHCLIRKAIDPWPNIG